MKRVVRDHDDDLAYVTEAKGSRFVFLKLYVRRFGGSCAAHCYTPSQARKLAKALMAVAAKAKSNVRRPR